MVMRRFIIRAMEVLEEASQEAPRPETYPTELYTLSGYRGEEEPGHSPIRESELGDENRPVRLRSSGPIVPLAGRTGTWRAEIVRALSSPAGVQQALIMQEIIGPPKALRPSDDDLR